MKHRVGKKVPQAVVLSAEQIAKEKEESGRFAEKLKVERAFNLFELKTQLDVITESIRDIDATLKMRTDELKKNPKDMQFSPHMHFKDGVFLSTARLEAERQALWIGFRKLAIDWKAKKEELTSAHGLTDEGIQNLFDLLVVGKKQEDAEEKTVESNRA